MERESLNGVQYMSEAHGGLVANIVMVPTKDGYLFQCRISFGEDTLHYEDGSAAHCNEIVMGAIIRTCLEQALSKCTLKSQQLLDTTVFISEMLRNIRSA